MTTAYFFVRVAAISRILIVLLLGSLLSGAVLSAPTGLSLMPTAETVPVGTTRFDYETNGGGKLFVPVGSELLGTQFALTNSIEGGIDRVTDSGTRYNAKWVILPEGAIMPAIAVGAQNVGSGSHTDYYAVASKSVLPGGRVKVHAGLLRAEEDDVTMLGASARFGPISLMVDRLDGSPRDGQAYGISYQFGTLTFRGTRYDYADISDTTTLMVSYTYRSGR